MTLCCASFLAGLWVNPWAAGAACLQAPCLQDSAIIPALEAGTYVQCNASHFTQGVWRTKMASKELSPNHQCGGVPAPSVGEQDSPLQQLLLIKNATDKIQN